jgi:alginate O-acetyltransferase complex protein AlgI
MVFASPIFLLLFMPLTLAAYMLARGRGKNVVLLVASVVFYLWGEGRFLALLVASVLANWAFGRAIASSEDPRVRRRWLVAAVAVNLAALGFFKYTDFALANVNELAVAIGMAAVPLAAIPLPLGISFFTFHAISYVVDVYKRNAEAEPRLPVFALYIMLFPQLIAGPIIRWRDIAAQLPERETRLADFAYGVRRFVLGLGKKMLIANTLGRVADAAFAVPASELNTPLAWLGLACYTLQIYFDFSGYSDMAIGLMRMFGFRILENFNYPYIAQSVREFWRRWHISLSNWFRDYLYIPLGGNRRGKLRGYVNLVIVFLLCGLWHGASWPFVLWGIWHGLFLVAERAGLERVLERVRALRHAYALAAIVGGWVLFRCNTLAHAVGYYRALFGFATADPMLHPVEQWLDGLTVFTLIVAAIGSTPIARRIGEWRDRSALVATGSGAAVLSLDVVWLGFLFIGAAAFLAAGTYNPFIYFRF